MSSAPLCHTTKSCISARLLTLFHNFLQLSYKYSGLHLATKLTVNGQYRKATKWQMPRIYVWLASWHQPCTCITFGFKLTKLYELDFYCTEGTKSIWFFSVYISYFFIVPDLTVCRHQIHFKEQNSLSLQLLNKKLLEGYKHSTWCDFFHAMVQKYVSLLSPCVC